MYVNSPDAKGCIYFSWQFSKKREALGEHKQYERLKNLKALLEIYITDLCDELSDIIKEKMDVDTREIIRKYFN